MSSQATRKVEASAMSRSIPSAAVVAALIAALWCAASAGSAPSGSSVHAAGDEPAPAPAAPAGDPAAKGVFLVYSVNTTGEIDVCGCKRKKVRQGSITRRASYVRQARFQHANLLLVDGGNTLTGPDDARGEEHERKQTIEKAKVLVESYSRLGYRAMAIGNYDLLLGLPALEELRTLARFPFLSANLVDAASGETIFAPTAEVEVGGVKVGILGLTLEGFPQFYLDQGSPDRPLKLLGAIETAKKHVPGLRERNDVVIVLSLQDAATNRKLAAEVPGIDFLVDPFIELGNHKLWVDEDKVLERAGETLIVRMDAQGARLGTLDLTIGGAGRPFVDLADESAPAGRSSYWFERISLEPHMLEDPEIALLVEAYKKQASIVDVGTLPPLPHKDRYRTSAVCQACHQEQYDFWKGTKHGTAFASLEETGDQWRQDCISCHVLGYGQAFIAPADADPYKDVQCENCHGLNPQHPEDPAAHEWPKIEETACLVCHNPEQTRTPFHFFEEKPRVACPPLKRE